MNNRRLPWQKKSSETPIDFRIFKARRDYYHHENGKPFDITILESNDASNVVAITKEGRVVMVNQYRFGVDKMILEVPGGMVDSGEKPEAAARRELQEETGYASKNWHYLGAIHSNPVFIDADIHHWLALDVEPILEDALEDAEVLEVVEVPLEQVVEMIRNGKIQHPHTLSALIKALLFLGKM